jgi:ABC-type Fe3+/spermidine/putrescine transport system ATPase subunit
MRVIAGLESCDAGQVMIDGRDATREPPGRRGIGMVFQSYALFPHMTVAQNIGYGLRVQGRPRAEIAARTAEMLALIRLPNIAARRPAALSGGQQQRVALARALATRPAVLMLDEPLGALDLKLRKELQAELRRIHRATGMTFLFVTHDQEEALFLSDRIAIMRDGGIEQLDRPDAIYHAPATAYVADFIGDVTLLPCEADSNDASLAHPDGWPGAEPIRLASPAVQRHFRLVVRPEDVALSCAAGAGIPTVVEEVIHEGSTTLVLLAGPAGGVLKARLIGRSSIPLQLGARVTATIGGSRMTLPAAAP